MSKVKKFTHFNEKEFKIVKLMQDAGLGTSKICMITGRSSGTIWRAMSANSFADYQKSVREQNAKNRKHVIDTPDSNTTFTEEIKQVEKSIGEIHIDKDLKLILTNLTEATNRQAQAWEELSGKLDVIIDGKRAFSFGRR